MNFSVGFYDEPHPYAGQPYPHGITGFYPEFGVFRDVVFHKSKHQQFEPDTIWYTVDLEGYNGSKSIRLGQFIHHRNGYDKGWTFILSTQEPWGPRMVEGFATKHAALHHALRTTYRWWNTEDSSPNYPKRPAIPNPGDAFL